MLARPLLCLCLALSAAPAGALDKSQADAEKGRLWSERQATLKAERAAEVEAKSITLDGKTMPWLEKTFGTPPEGGASLWISMHGGGNAPAALNDSQWKNQIRLYQPAEGIYLAPRAPTNTWNLWHEAHIDAFFDRLIEDFVAVRGVNPDRVYIMGYSAGGDGVWQLAPRMADRWAAAAMMAGHPNDASLLSVRNLPLALFVGGRDAAFDRNKIVAARGVELDSLQKADPAGYVHLVRVYEGLPHWMNLKDAEAVPWMAQHTRNPWPKKVVWVQDDVTHTRFYWLAVAKEHAKAGQKLTATVDGQTISLEGELPPALILRLSDELLDLDQPVKVVAGAKELFSGKVTRNPEVIRRSLEQRGDIRSAATAELVVKP